MAMVELEIASRYYSVGCRDGEEEHLKQVAEIVDRKAMEAAQALGGLSETRHLLFTSLLLADELKERRDGGPGAPPPAPAPPPEPDPAVAIALEALADRIERLADRLEQADASA